MSVFASKESDKNETKRNTGSLRKEVDALLRADNFGQRLAEWDRFSPRKVINPLFSYLCSTDEPLKWRAVTAMGVVMARMADEDMEPARDIMRRLIWNLNDESGGIGWGCPEAMGEIMASHERLAREFYCILVSYIHEEGNRLGHGLLERGVLWGLGRLAQVRAPLLLDCASCILPYLQSADSFHRGLAVWALGILKFGELRGSLASLLDDRAQVSIYENGELSTYRVCDLAARVLDALA